MDPRFDAYGTTVCTFVRHATAKEKASIRAELSAHIEDHAQALMDAGYDGDRALSAAVAAMGDPEEVGKALNKEYPLGRLILSRVILLPLALVALLAAGALLSGLFGLPEHLQARFPPSPDELTAQGLAPLDLRLTLSNGDVIRIYAADLLWQEANGYTGYVAHLYAGCYNKNPFRSPYYSALSLDFASQDPSNELFVTNDGSQLALYGLKENDQLTVRLDLHGHALGAEVPLPWEEVTHP